jgi:hypothetical protein
MVVASIDGEIYPLNQLLNGFKINETPYGKSITITDVKGQLKFEVSGNAWVRQKIG